MNLGPSVNNIEQICLLTWNTHLGLLQKETVNFYFSVTQKKKNTLFWSGKISLNHTMFWLWILFAGKLYIYFNRVL